MTHDREELERSGADGTDAVRRGSIASEGQTEPPVLEREVKFSRPDANGLVTDAIEGLTASAFARNAAALSRCVVSCTSQPHIGVAIGTSSQSPAAMGTAGSTPSAGRLPLP